MFDQIKEQEYFDEYDPEKVIIQKNPSINRKGTLVIDNTVYGLPVGGIRMAPDLTLKEIIRLSRAMTLKYCTYKIPLSEAKAGIICGNELDIKNKFLYNFVFSIKAMIKQAHYFPEPG